jgi:hypothetical protein
MERNKTFYGGIMNKSSLAVQVVAGASLSSLAGLWLVQQREKRRINHIWRSLEKPVGQQRFAPDMVADLPEIAQRYFLHAIKPGTPIASSVYLTYTGYQQAGPSAKQYPSQGHDILITPGQGFVWKEGYRAGPIRRNGVLTYANKEGSVKWTYYNLIPDFVKSRHNANSARGMLGRFITKYIWTPFALLPQQGAVWELIDDEHAKVTVFVDGTPTTLTLHIDQQGRLLESVSLRWGAKTEDGSYAYFPYRITVAEEKTFQGYTIPSQVTAAWTHDDPNRQPPLMFHYRITRAEFR